LENIKAEQGHDERTLWKAVTDDVNWVNDQQSLSHAELASGLISRPLWIDDVRGDETFRVNFPIWARRPWDLLKKMPAARGAGFEMWLRWYESLLLARTQGCLDGALKGEAERKIAIHIATQTDEFWLQYPPTLNAEIRTWIKEAKDVQLGGPPKVPETRPAAIEPLWLDGKLALPAASLPSDLDEASLLAALGALREDLAELAADVVLTQNIDHRPAEYLRRLADRIPNAMPSQALLFRLGHANEVLSDLTHTTDIEWPDLLAARYRRLALQYERTVRQFPKWRAFVRNAAEQSLTAEQIAEVPQIVETVVAELQTNDAREFIDQAIPEALKATQAPIVDWNESISLGKEQLAEDLLESINNVLKRTVEFSLALKSAGVDPVMSWVGATARKSLEEFGKEANKSIVKEFGKFGKATGPALGRFLKRIAKITTYGGPAAGGGVLLLQRLFTMYPDTFGWLEPVFRFLHLL
jgi:hypothetical protein